jgi:transposase-like protein
MSNCPNSHCNSLKNGPNAAKDGLYLRASDSRVIQRYKCKLCHKRFSAATSDPSYRQKKRRINSLFLKLISSGVSLRRSALILNVNKKTTERRLRHFGRVYKEKHQKWLLEYQLVNDFQFDDLQTIEHTKLKPLSVTMAVETETRKIIGFEVSRMPATGHLAKISVAKYGKRKDERQQGIDRLFTKIQNQIASNSKIMSDMHPFYKKRVTEYFPNSKYEQVKGLKACVAGQGELKKSSNDPLFKLNHTFAMLRANINRLFRKTWCTTKIPKRLEDHLYIYIHFHNNVLVK